MSEKRVDTAECYQKVYDQNPRYGCAATGSCPAVRLLPLYLEWLLSPVLDLGCGNGDTVDALECQGFGAVGIDFIRSAKTDGTRIRTGDITKPIDNIREFRSGLCIDVLEHVDPANEDGLLGNLAQLQRQVISVNNASSVNVVDGQRVELHINRRPFDQWRTILEKHLVIEQTIEIHANQQLYLCQERRDEEGGRTAPAA